LIITEGVAPSPNGLGYARIPGVFNQAQKAGWEKVTNMVHENGGRIFVQLMHTGRVSHPDNMPEEARVIAPSAIVAPDTMWTDQGGAQEYPVPETMNEEDINNTITEYASAAQLAMSAGFDGVELHGANGYLIDQFLNTASNQRTDQWGGSPENRIRFAVSVAKSVIAKIGADRVGMRISPYGVFNGMQADSQMDETFALLASEMDKLKLLYLHIVDHSSMGAPEVSPEIKSKIRSVMRNTIILSGGYDAARANQDLNDNKGDLVAFGRLFISNPTLVEKLQSGEELTPFDSATFYTADEKGYTDYV
jgi:N-ethylmaleimide reductase